MPAKVPDWVKQQRKPGMEIRQQRGQWYAYRITSKYDPTIKRSRKITLGYLGKVTPEGIVPPRHERQQELGAIMEAGHLTFLTRFTQQIKEPLATAFPDTWQSLLAMAALKLCYREPCSRLRLRYQTSLAKRLWPNAKLSKNSLPGLLLETGQRWAAQRDFFLDVARDEKHMAIDLSHVFSESQNIPWLEYGHNGDDVWKPQLQVLLMWGTTTHTPGFLKLLPGATHSAQTVANAVKDAPFQEIIAIMDKGFWSQQNADELEAAGIHYAIALRRDLPFVEHVAPSRYKNEFLRGGLSQAYRSTQWHGRTIHHYFDASLAHRESSAYLRRIESGEGTKQNYRKLKNSFGTLAIITDTGLSAEDTYDLYRERREVEYGYDALQNTLQADTTWMRSREAMSGYFFVQFLALHLYAQVLEHLKRKKLLGRYSVLDVLTLLSKITLAEMGGEDRWGEITKQTRKAAELLEVPITETTGL